MPVCVEYLILLENPRAIKGGMSVFKCTGCTRNYRYRMKKGGGWYAGKRQCDFCDGYGCTSVRYVGKKCLHVVDVDESSSDSLSENEE